MKRKNDSQRCVARRRTTIGWRICRHCLWVLAGRARKHRAVACLLLLSLGGCAVIEPTTTEESAPVFACRALFKEMDLTVERAGSRDQGPVAIDGFPFLRVNRITASFAGELATQDQFRTWVEHLAQLDAHARTIELRNLKSDTPANSLVAELEGCRDLLVARLLADERRRTRLLEAVEVPDDYVTGWRIAGLYPISSQFVARGVRRGQEASRQVFAKPLEALPVKGHLQRWGSTELPVVPEYESLLDPLGIPLFSDAQITDLFRRHAPIWEVDVVDDNDLVGAAVWRSGPSVDTALATQYQKVSYTRFGRHVLLQLNYVIWFKARPGDDIYSGPLDSLIWRVTLGPDGEPWLYDSIHSCGCYHTFLPTEHLRLRDDLPVRDFEPPLVPQRAPAPPMVVRVASGTHYLQRVYTNVAPNQERSDIGNATGPRTPSVGSLVVDDYEQLRSLPDGEGHRSFFGKHGIVEESRRGERFILWPMGVRSPGAMRVWGHQPVAFVGRRHFDDARMLESLFLRDGQ